MNIFKWLTRAYRKIKWVVNFIFVFISPIYDDLKDIVKAIKDENLTNEEKLAKVKKEVNDIIKEKGLNIPDSVVNAAIEIVYLLVKNKKD